jgi:tetratricopeptide (TPR) repeat protein
MVLQRVDVLDWLAPPNVSADLLTHSAKSLSGTGTWIFEEPQFCDWRDRNETSVLWVCGAPGTGKTVLGAQVVQHFANLDVSEECSTTFYFFDKSIRPERPLEVLAAAIMSQIVHQSRSLDTVVVSAYETSQRFGRSRMSYLDDPFRLLKAMAAKLGRLNIILDGLDECDNGEEILLAVKGLLASAANIHIAVFSRDVPWIRIHMGCAAAIELNSSRNRSDMTHYVQKSIARLMLDDPTLEAKIADIVTRKADGMFLWTACVMENLRSATNPIEALEVLDLLPPGIDAYYNSCLYRLSQDHVRRRGLAENMLRWMCCSGRPLSWPEVRSCLGLANEADQQEGLHFPFQSVVLDVCAPFIKLDAITATFRFQHNSAREFLLQKTKASDAGRFCVDEAETHQSLAHICLRQLLSQERDANFTQYATQYWLDHLLQATWNIDLQNLVRKLVGDSAVMEKWFIDRIRWDEQRGFSMSKILGSQPLLNDWMRSTAHSKQTQELDWTKSLVHTLLRLDEDGEYCGHGYQALRLSHLENLMIVRDLARVLTQSRRIDEGITWFKAALCHRKKQEAAQAAHCWILSALGILYDQRNDIRGSLDIHSHVLSVQELELGQQSLETIWTVNELGRVYRHLGNFDKAEEHHRRALKVLLEILPDDHLEVVWTMNTLARSYRKSGRITEALALHRTALAGQERALGVTHPHPLWTRGDIGKCYHGLGLVREAEEFHRASLTGRLSVLGAAHVDTLWSMAKVGQVLSTRKQYEEAGDLLQRALKGQISSLGDQNSQTIKTAMALQNLLSVQGNHSRMHMSEEGLRL